MLIFVLEFFAEQFLIYHSSVSSELTPKDNIAIVKVETGLLADITISGLVHNSVLHSNPDIFKFSCLSLLCLKIRDADRNRGISHFIFFTGASTTRELSVR